MRHNKAEQAKTSERHWLITKVLQELKCATSSEDKIVIEPGQESALIDTVISKVKPHATGEMLYCVGFRPLSKLFKVTAKPELRLVSGDAE